MSNQTNVQSQPEQESQNGNDFGFKTESSQSDMTLIVGSVPLFVNKAVLEIASPVLKKIFDEQLQGGDKRQVTLDEVDAEGFIEFLACFYPSCVHKVRMSNVFRILPLAYKYQVARLMEKSVALLIKSLTGNQKEDHIYKCLSIAEQQSITTLEGKCVEVLVEIFKTDVQRADEIITLKADVKEAVTSAVIPLLRSEASKYRFLAAGPTCRDIHLDLKNFNDAKYLTFQFQINPSEVFREKKISSFHVWNFDLNIATKLGPQVDSVEFTFETSGYNCMIAVKMTMRNNNTGREDYWKQEIGITYLSIEFTSKKAKTLGIPWTENFTIVAHVLLNKPTVPERHGGPHFYFSPRKR